MKALFFVFSIFISSSALASQFGLVGGLNMAEVEADASGGLTADYERELGFNIGFRYYSELNGFRFRTGGQISQYNTSFEGTWVHNDYSFLQLMIPVTAQFSVNEVFSIFGGAGVSVHLSDDLEVDLSDDLEVDLSDDLEVVGGDASDPENKSIWLTLQLGASVMFTEKTSLEFVFDYGITDLATDANGNALALNFVYML